MSRDVLRMTRRRFGGLLSGALGFGVGALGGAKYGSWLINRFPMDDAFLSSMTSLARGIGVPLPSPQRLAEYRGYLSVLGRRQPMLAAEYLKFHFSLKRLGKARSIEDSGWSDPETATALLGAYFESEPSALTVKYADRRVPLTDVVLKDMLLFIAGEAPGQLEFIALEEDKGEDAQDIEIGKAADTFNESCSSCHQASGLRRMDASTLRTSIERGTVMSTRANLRSLGEAQIREIVAYLSW
jgi:hypothetical protein